MDSSGKQIIKKEDSLLRKVTVLTMGSSFAIGMVILVIGLSLYGIALTGQYITESFTLARSAAIVVNNVTDTELLSNAVMDIYRGVSDEVRENQYDPEYRDRFTEIETDKDYLKLQMELRRLTSSSDVRYLYLGMYDIERQALVYICDPDEDPKTLCKSGEWEIAEADELEKFTTWDGTGQLYDIGTSMRHGYMCTSGYPLKNDQGETYAFMLADVTLMGVIKGISLLALQYAVALIVALIVIGQVSNKRMQRLVVDPINSISLAAQEYVKDRSTGNISTDHFEKLGIHTGDEIEQLSIVMSDMEHNISEYETELSAAIAEQEKAHTEMSLASRIQKNMLPGKFPAFPDRDDFEIYASMDPAKEVGGDYYDFFMIDDDHLCFFIADVSGKGIPAALFMMATMIILANTAMNTDEYDTSRMLNSANSMICRHNEANMFVTVWIGILELSTGKLRASNAGHEYPVIRYPNGKYEMIRDKHGLVLGAMSDSVYNEYFLQMEPGTTLFLYTDGVPEATDENGELFGTERLVETLNNDVEADPEKVLDNVKSAVDQFVGDVPQFDDLTMLCIEYKK